MDDVREARKALDHATAASDLNGVVYYVGTAIAHGLLALNESVQHLAQAWVQDDDEDGQLASWTDGRHAN